MRTWSVLLLTAALRIVQTKDDPGEPLEIYKCCGPFQMLSGDGSACVNATWSHNRTLRARPQRDYFDLRQVLVQPGDAPWVGHWLPPGLPFHRVGEVHVGFLDHLKSKHPQRQTWTVEESAEWDERQAEAGGYPYWSRRVVFIKNQYGSVMGPEPRPFFASVLMGLGGYRPVGKYCVDAAQPPLGPFALMAERDCELHACVRKCCAVGEVVVAVEGDGTWGCRADRERSADWPRRSSFASLLPSEDADEYYDRQLSCIERQVTDSVTTLALHLSPEDELAAHLLQQRYHDYMWSTWDTCVDLELFQNWTLRDTIFYCPESRITRGTIWLLRHLCFISLSLLVVALASVVSNSGMRLKAHGWCLACHTSCLLGFNLGQVSYNMTIGDQVDAFGFVPPHLRNMCRTFAFPMYFLLMAANCWLTALCFNMTLGFRQSHSAGITCVWHCALLLWSRVHFDHRQRHLHCAHPEEGPVPPKRQLGPPQRRGQSRPNASQDG